MSRKHTENHLHISSKNIYTTLVVLKLQRFLRSLCTKIHLSFNRTKSSYFILFFTYVSVPVLKLFYEVLLDMGMNIMTKWSTPKDNLHSVTVQSLTGLCIQLKDGGGIQHCRTRDGPIRCF